jgi:hypothetical protein
MNIKFPIGTKTAAKLLNKSQVCIRKHCACIGVPHFISGNKNTPFTIYENDFNELKKRIHESPGNPEGFNNHIRKKNRFFNLPDIK